MKNAPDYAKHHAERTPNNPDENRKKKAHLGRIIEDNMELFPCHFTDQEEK